MKKILLCSLALVTLFEASAQSSKKKGETPAPVTVLNYYYELPQEYLPQVGAYIARRKQEAPLVKTVDNKDLRTGFILNKDLERGYLNLQLPNDPKYTRIQLFKDDKSPVLAIEVTECNPKCQNTLTFYKKSYFDSTWKESNMQYMPTIDMDYVRKKVKDTYKKEYMDLELFNSLGYESSDVLQKAIVYNISPDANKIVIREQSLPLDLYEMTWNAEKAKFELKKL
jgi:hypothetical protein